jgi:hypothetical protein
LLHAETRVGHQHKKIKGKGKALDKKNETFNPT